jgi:hypothetical protein
MERAFRDARHGFQRGRPWERAGFGFLSSLALTVTLSRAINYALELRRPAPPLRSFARRIYHAPRRGEMRVHHFVPGMGIGALTGAAAILTRDDRREFILSMPFGVGAGLTLDELALLVRLDNPYWGKEEIPLAQASGGALGAGLLGLHFWLRGRRERRAGRQASEAGDCQDR